jgi:hypothetical protein
MKPLSARDCRDEEPARSKSEKQEKKQRETQARAAGSTGERRGKSMSRVETAATKIGNEKIPGFKHDVVDGRARAQRTGAWLSEPDQKPRLVGRMPKCKSVVLRASPPKPTPAVPIETSGLTGGGEKAIGDAE